MKRSKSTEGQIAFILRQAEVGIAVAEVCRKAGISEATFYIYGRLSRCKRILNGLRDQLQTSIRRQPGVPGAPKWQIRTREPLQVVGLEGLCKRQVYRAPV